MPFNVGYVLYIKYFWKFFLHHQNQPLVENSNNKSEHISNSKVILSTVLHCQQVLARKTFQRDFKSRNSSQLQCNTEKKVFIEIQASLFNLHKLAPNSISVNLLSTSADSSILQECLHNMQTFLLCITQYDSHPITNGNVTGFIYMHLTKNKMVMILKL